MKILYFYQYFGTPKGGWSTRVYEMTKRWAAAGAEVTVVTSLYDKSDLKPQGFVTNFIYDGVNVKLINVRMSNKDPFAKRIFLFAVYMLSSTWYALTMKADVVISSSGPITVGLPGILAKKIRRIPFIFEVRDLWPNGAIQIGAIKNKNAIKLARWFERSCYKNADHIVAASVDMKTYIQQFDKQKPITIVPNASDNELLQSMDLNFDLPDWARGKKLVLYTGTLGLQDECSAVVYLADELKKRERDDIEVILIGEGKERILLQEMAAQVKLEHIHFLGLISKENVMRWLVKSQVSLLTVMPLPYLDTASPNKLFDAFAAGVPVVQNTQGWIKTYLDDKNCGITVSHRNPSAMADAVLSIIDNPQTWQIMSDNAKKAAHEDFDRNVLAARMFEAIKVTVKSI